MPVTEIGQEMTNKSWKVSVGGNGWVSHAYGGGRAAVPHGDYAMRSIANGNYRLSRRGGPSFVLTPIDISTSLSERLLATDPLWPWFVLERPTSVLCASNRLARRI